jgi:enamine deaminase RidA (YjgF/YER057c/UK114 family)
MGLVEQRLADAGYVLPAPPPAAGDYVPAVRHESLVFTSGQLPMRDGSLITTGLVDTLVSTEFAMECAAVCALNAIAAASTVCDLDDVAAAVKLVGYVASADGFTAQPSVVNGASAVMHVAFGEQGVHAREAVGVASLPLGAPVEVSVVLGLEPSA